METQEAVIIARRYIDLLRGKYQIKAAVLFGSYARGKNNADSDIDVAIVVDNSDDIFDTQVDMMKLRRGVDLRIEPHPFLAADFNESNPLVAEILQKGIYL